MLGSLKGRIFLIAVLVVGLIAGFVMLFSQRQIERAMFDSEERSARNALELVTVDVESRHQNQIREKPLTIIVQRDRMRAEPVDILAEAAIGDVRTFAAGAVQSDDIIVFALRYLTKIRPEPHGTEPALEIETDASHT